MSSLHYLQTDDAGQLWLHLQAPSGRTTSICLSGLSSVGLVDPGGAVETVFKEIAALLASPDAAVMYGCNQPPETVVLPADDFDALEDRLAQPGEPCPNVARVLSEAPPWESPTASEPPNYVRQCLDGTWDGADHPSGPWHKVSRFDVTRWSTARKWLPTP